MEYMYREKFLTFNDLYTDYGVEVIGTTLISISTKQTGSTAT